MLQSLIPSLWPLVKTAEAELVNVQREAVVVREGPEMGPVQPRSAKKHWSGFSKTKSQRPWDSRRMWQ